MRFWRREEDELVSLPPPPPPQPPRSAALLGRRPEGTWRVSSGHEAALVVKRGKRFEGGKREAGAAAAVF